MSVISVGIPAVFFENRNSSTESFQNSSKGFFKVFFLRRSKIHFIEFSHFFYFGITSRIPPEVSHKFFLGISLDSFLHITLELASEVFVQKSFQIFLLKSPQGVCKGICWGISAYSDPLRETGPKSNVQTIFKNFVWKKGYEGVGVVWKTANNETAPRNLWRYLWRNRRNNLESNLCLNSGEAIGEFLERWKKQSLVLLPKYEKRLVILGRINQSLRWFIFFSINSFINSSWTFSRGLSRYFFFVFLQTYSLAFP